MTEEESKKYPTLRLISLTFKWLAYIFTVLGSVSLIVAASKISQYSPTMAFLAFVFLGIAIATTVVSYLGLSEAILLFLDMEENTEKTVKYLMEIKSNQTE